MNPYSFDELIDRRGTHSYKWDSADGDDVLPMWVADMDFRTAPAVTAALARRVEHGIFGYTRVPDAYYEAVAGWFSRRHGWTVSRDMICYTSGVVPALSATIKALAAPGDKVIVQTPVYNCFFSSIRNNGCEVLRNPLRADADSFRMDLEDLERKAADPRASLLLLCNPHNPAGRVWTRAELEAMAAVCHRHGVRVVSDEIHCELTFPGHDYTPFGTLPAELREGSVTLCSPTKAFNIAGLQIANIISTDADALRRIDRAININEVCDVNPFGVVALIAAYNEGAPWLDALRRYLWDNYTVLRQYFADHMPQLPVARLEGTYLVWVDCRALGMPAEKMERRLLASQRLWLNAGTMYGAEGFMRINIACPRSRMLDGLERLRRFADSL